MKKPSSSLALVPAVAPKPEDEDPLEEKETEEGGDQEEDEDPQENPEEEDESPEGEEEEEEEEEEEKQPPKKKPSISSLTKENLAKQETMPLKKKMELYRDGKLGLDKFSHNETKAMWGQCHTAVDQNKEASALWSSIIKEKNPKLNKNKFLKSWLKDPSMGKTFWRCQTTMSLLTTRTHEGHWKTQKQMFDKYGQDCDEMKSCLPKRKHPSNPRVIQWLDMDEKIMTAWQNGKVWAHEQKKEVKGSQSQMLKDALSMEMDDDMVHNMSTNMADVSSEEQEGEKKQEEEEEDEEEEKAEPQDPVPKSKNKKGKGKGKDKQPKKTKKDNKDGSETVASKKTMAERMTEDVDQSAVALQKAKKMLGLQNNLITSLKQAEYLNKKCKYQADKKLKTDVGKNLQEMDKAKDKIQSLVVEGAKNVKATKKELEAACLVYENASKVLSLMKKLNKQN